MIRLLLLLSLLLLPATASEANLAVAAEAEVSRCRERLASVQRDILGKYEDQLGELQAQFQKAADLDGALATRAEKLRLRTERTLGESNFSDPRALRALQQSTLARLDELRAGVVSESIPRLVEMKNALTIAGQLDEAVQVRTSIEKLQNDHIPLTRPNSGELVTVDTLATAYAADRARADKAYKDANITVRGTMAAYRIDAQDSRKATVYLGRPGGLGWVACVFEDGLRFREEKSFNTAVLVVSTPNGPPIARWQNGQGVEIVGTCEGFSDVVRIGRCSLPK